MGRRDANLAKCTEHDSKQRAIVDCLCTRLYQLLLSQDCLWTRLVHLLLSQLSCGRVVQALLSRKAPVFKEGWAAFQPVFKEGWTAFQQLAFKAGRLFSSWPFGHFANKMTTPMPQSVGPKFARNALISLDKLCTNPQFSGGATASRHAQTNFIMRRSRPISKDNGTKWHWRRASQIQLHFRAIFDEHLEQKF